MRTQKDPGTSKSSLLPDRKSKFIWNKIPPECLTALDQQLEAIMTKTCSDSYRERQLTVTSNVCSLANHFSFDDVTIKEKINLCRIHHHPAENSMPKPLELISVHLQHTFPILWLK